MPTHTSGLAIASLVLSCLTVPLGPLGCIPGIICGHIARSKCSEDPSLSGAGIALAGLIIGYSFLVLMVLVSGVMFLLVLFGTTSEPLVYPLF